MKKDPAKRLRQCRRQRYWVNHVITHIGKSHVSLPFGVHLNAYNLVQLIHTHQHWHICPCLTCNGATTRYTENNDSTQQQQQPKKKNNNAHGFYRSTNGREKKSMWKQPLECWLSGWLIAKLWVTMKLTSEIKIG